MRCPIRTLRRIAGLIVACLCGTASSFDNPAIAWGQEVNPAAGRFALLIGVGEYPRLSRQEQLDGSVNDVVAMQEMLIGRFGFAPEQVTVLINKEATGAGIRAALRNVVEAVGQLPAGSPAAQVVVHFSGHGSQVPDQADGPDRDEDDGLDETWVPYDAEQQGGDQDIRDDEINAFAHAICAEERARLFIIVDGCHSGTGARGATKIRQLRRSLTPTPATDIPITRKRLPPGAVFLSACQAREVEPEFQEGEKTYGLLTRFLVEALSEEQNVSRLTYDLLQKAIVSRYQRDRRVMQPPTPQLEGNLEVLLKSSVLGFGTEVDRAAYYPVNVTSPEMVLLQAGRFHNVNVGSLFELYEQPDQIDTSPALAWLEVTLVEGTSSAARVFRWDGDERIAHALPADFKGGLGVLREQGLGDVGLRLKVVRSAGGVDSSPLNPEDPLVPEAVRRGLQSDSAPRGPAIEWVTETHASSDVLLRIDNDHAAIFPATGTAQIDLLALKTRGSLPESLRGGWGPFDLREQDASQSLSDALQRIVRARNLISLARNAPKNDAGYDVQLELMKLDLDRETDQVRSQKPWPVDAGTGDILTNTYTVRDHEVYAIRVTNRQTDGKPIYVTVLEISPDMGIEVVVPFEEPPIRLEPGEHRDGDPFETQGIHGQWHAVVLATREPSDFSFVAQAHLTRTRGAPLPGGAGLLSDQLAVLTDFQQPATRGRRVKPKSTDQSWSAQVLTWRAAP